MKVLLMLDWWNGSWDGGCRLSRMSGDCRISHTTFCERGTMAHALSLTSTE
jgi:hypothetical protein